MYPTYLSFKNRTRFLTFLSTILKNSYLLFNIKLILLKLLCSLSHFWEGNYPSTTPTRLLWINFPLHTCSQFLSLTFCGQDNRTREKVRRSHERAPLPICPTLATLRPPHLPLIPCQGKNHALVASFRFTSHHPQRECFTLCWHRNFLCMQSTCLVFVFYVSQQPWSMVIPTPPRA